MVAVTAKIEGQEVVASASIVLSDDYRVSVCLDDLTIEFRITEDEGISRSTSEAVQINDKHIKYTLTNWGKHGIVTTGEMERAATVDDVDYNMAVSVQSISGALKSRIFSYTVWVAGKSLNG